MVLTKYTNQFIPRNYDFQLVQLTVQLKCKSKFVVNWLKSTKQVLCTFASIGYLCNVITLDRIR